MSDMPWSGIFKRTAQIAAVVFVTLTGLCAAELRRLQNEKKESERPKWTDAARWEK